jgi:opacity protein-like surface antigen
VFSPAHAQEASDGHFYIAAAATGSDMKRPRQTIANAPTPGSTLQVVNAVDFGWGGQAAFGYSSGYFRIEAEVGRTENDSDSYTAITPLSITLPQKGKNNLTRFMANAYVQLPEGRWAVSPYVGAGFGYARARVTTFAAPARAPAAPPSQLIDQKDGDTAYQLIAGVAVPLTSRVALTVQYRWFDAGTAVGVDARGERMTRSLRGGNYDLGIRLRL